MTDSDLIDLAGGTSKVAKICDIKPPSVTGWRKHGIPKAQRNFLRLRLPEVFAVIEQKPPPALAVPAQAATDSIAIPDAASPDGREFGH